MVALAEGQGIEGKGRNICFIYAVFNYQLMISKCHGGKITQLNRPNVVPGHWFTRHCPPRCAHIGQPRHTIYTLCPGSAPEPLSGRTYLQYQSKEVSREQP